MVDDRVGDDADPVARGLDPPAEVDVLPVEPHAGIEAADLVPHVAADQHPGAAHGERVPVAVVLALVDLARLDPGDPAAGRSMPTPASSRTSRSDQSMTLGPSTAAAGTWSAPRSSCSSASGAGSQSSCSSHTHSVRSAGAPAGGGRWVVAARCRSAWWTAAA